MKKKERTIIAIIVIITAVVVVTTTIMSCIKDVREQLSTQMQQALEKTAEQNAYNLEKELDSTYELLDGLALELQERNIKNRTVVIEFLNSYAHIYQFKRMGFVSGGGIAYTTDGYTQTVDGAEFYQMGMRGKKMVSDRLPDIFDEEEDVFIFSVPVYSMEQTEIIGVLFAAYDAAQFSAFLSQDTYAGQGSCMVINEDGQVIAGVDIFFDEDEVNTIDALSRINDENRKKMFVISQDMAMGKTGYAQVFCNENYYLYYKPIEIAGEDNDWYVFTAIPEEVLTNQFNPIEAALFRLLMVVVFVAVIVLALYIAVYHNQRKMLIKLAYRDPLTKGDNYACFKEKISELRPVSGSIVSLDIGDFKIINSICGESTGDMVIRSLWQIIETALWEEDLAAHINADEFILYLKSTNETEIEERLVAITQEIYDLIVRLQIPRVEPYYGICALDDYEKIEKIYSQAVQAKNNVKGRRDSNLSFYSDKVFKHALEDKKLIDSFENAITMHEFEVWYQPKYDTMEGSVTGAEALVRWRQNGELIPPYRFIPLFEKHGMIAALDEYVFRHVCEQQKKWQEEGRVTMPVSINISRASLFYSGIAGRYEEILHECNLPAEYVQLEMTESAMLENDDISSIMEHFSRTGFKLLLDDFGNGYSSLSTLNTMNFDVLKLDKGLIDYIGDSKGEELLRHMIELAKLYGLGVTAEGVETKDQLDFLQQVACDDVQGYYFSKPIPEKEFEQLLITE